MEKETQEQRSTSFSSTTKKTMKVVQHSSESVESSFGEYREGSPSSTGVSRTEKMHIQKVFNSMGELALNPLMNLGSRFEGKDSDFEDVSTHISCINQNNTFEMKLDVTEYSPEDIQVKVLDDMVVITGKQEIKISENNMRSRSFSKKFSIPQGVEPESIKCSLSKDGYLKISAAIVQGQEQMTSSTQSVVGSNQTHQTQQQQQQQITSSTQSVQQSHHQTQQQQTQVIKTEHRRQSFEVSSNNSSQDKIDTQAAKLCLEDGNFITPRKVNAGPRPAPNEFGTIVTGNTFTIRAEITKFVAEEIKVKVTNSLIKIEGKHESEFASRSFYKEFTVLSGVKLDSLDCTMTTDGILTITAPIEPQGQSPITHTPSSNTTQDQEMTRVTKVETAEQIQKSTAKNVETFNLTPTLSDDEVIPADAQDITNDVTHLNNNVEVKVNVSKYRREEIQIRITRKTAIIRATSDTTFVKKFEIPEGVKPQDITSNISPDGILSITAPVVVQPEPPTLQSPPIGNLPEQKNAIAEEKVIQQQTKVTTEVVQEATQENVTKQEQLPNTQAPAVRSPETPQLPSEATPVLTSPQQPKPSTASPATEHGDIIVPVKDVLNIEEVPQDGTPMFEPKDKIFKATVNVSEYKREEIFVKISKTMVVVEGKHESEFASRSFYKKIPIPHEAEPNVECGYTPNGVLVITAPPKIQSHPNQGQVKENTTMNQTDNKETIQTEQHLAKQTQESLQAKTQIEQTDDMIVMVPEVSPVNTSEPPTPGPDPEDEIPKEISVINDGQKYEMTLDVSKYKKEEISIKATKTTIRIEGKQTTKYSSRSFYKETPLPNGVKPESVTSDFKPNGHLQISAPIEKSPAPSAQSIKTSDTKNSQEHTHIVQIKETQIAEKKVTKSTSDEEVNKVKEVNDGKTFQVTINVSEYKREEIKIKITKTVIRVEATQTTKFSTKSFFKEITIPDGVEPKSIKSNISPQGILTVSAPVDQMLLQKTVQQRIESTKATHEQQIDQRQQEITTEQQRIQTTQKQNTLQQQTKSVQQQQQLQKSSSGEIVLKSVFDLNAKKETISGATTYQIDQKETNFTMVYDVSGYNAEDITITITKYVVTVHGKQQTEFSSKSFSKKFSIPHGVNPTEIRTTLKKGILTFSAAMDQTRSYREE